MGDIEFRCMGCSETLVADDECAGENMECPSCKCELQVPQADFHMRFHPPPPPTPPVNFQSLPPVTPLSIQATPFVPVPQPSPTTGRVQRKRKTNVLGILVELVGLFLLFVFPFGTIVGIILLFLGGRMSLRLVCSECGNRVEDKSVRMCPVCRAILG
jgi:hypothetical protein